MDSTKLTPAQVCRLQHAITFTQEAMALCGVPYMLRRLAVSAVDREMRELFARGEQTPNCATEDLWRERDLHYYSYRDGDFLAATSEVRYELPFLHQG